MSYEKKQTLRSIDVFKNFHQSGNIQYVLRGISVQFEQGLSYAITGVSGSGKSTFLHLLGGLDTPSAGHILFNNLDLSSLKFTDKNNLLNKSLGFVFQFHYLIKELSVIENIMLPGLVRGDDRLICRARAMELLDMMGLIHKEQAYPATLSGGEQQRIAIARALFNKPVFLLADEPTGNLDADNARIVVDLFFKAQSEWGMGVILCSHDPAVYERMNKIYYLDKGLIVNK